MDANGSNQVRLTRDSAMDTAPTWSPDGRKIAFRSDRDGNFEIYVMAVAGGPATRLTTTDQGEGALSWSPDGTTVLYGLNSGTANIVRIDVGPMLP